MSRMKPLSADGRFTRAAGTNATKTHRVPSQGSTQCRQCDGSSTGPLDTSRMTPALFLPRANLHTGPPACSTQMPPCWKRDKGHTQLSKQESLFTSQWKSASKLVKHATAPKARPGARSCTNLVSNCVTWGNERVNDLTPTLPFLEKAPTVKECERSLASPRAGTSLGRSCKTRRMASGVGSVTEAASVSAG